MAIELTLNFVSPYAKLIANMLAWNTGMIHDHADDISQEESLIDPPDGGNNMNWTIGHIVKYRGLMLERAGYEIPWPTDKYDRFKRHSAALTDPNEAASMQEMLADLDRSQEILEKWLESATDEVLEQDTAGNIRSLGGMIGRLAWHEGYHIGQLEILRNMAGKHEPVFI
jgi:uncharacterized damage-inducible protein DinB